MNKHEQFQTALKALMTGYQMTTVDTMSAFLNIAVCDKTMAVASCGSGRVVVMVTKAEMTDYFEAHDADLTDEHWDRLRDDIGDVVDVGSIHDESGDRLGEWISDNA